MVLGTAFTQIAFSHFNILSTTVLALLLLLLEKLLESKFSCPENPTMSLVYSVTFICVPIFILLLLGLKYNDASCSKCTICAKKSPSESEEEVALGVNDEENTTETHQGHLSKCAKESPSEEEEVGWCQWCKDTMFILVKIFTAPVLWFLIVLADGRYLGCFTDASMKPLTQVIGLVGLGVLIACSLCLPSCTCVKKTITYWKREKYRGYLVKAVEELVRKKANKKQETFAEEMIQEKFPDARFTTSIPSWMEELEIIVHEAKNHANERFNIMINEHNPGGGRRESNVYDSNGYTPI